MADERGYRYQIRDTQTGETRLSGFKSDTAEPRAFWWLEGNYGCDCNRKLDFERAGGREPDDDETPCSQDKNRYVFDWVECNGVRFIENDTALTVEA